MGVSPGDVAVAVLLAVGVASALMGALGILATRNPYDQLHFTGPATVIGPTAIAAAVLVEEPLSSAGIKSVLIAVIMLGTGPILLHATARAARIRERGRWVLLREELESKEEPSRSSRR
jgi:multicomponent Na+:H+ antiporter subunit G